MTTSTLRHDWSRTKILALFDLPFNDLLFRAQQVHRAHFDPNQDGEHAALHQKRCLPRRLQILPAERPLRHRPGRKKKLLEVEKVIEEARTAASKRFLAFLHGRGVAFTR